MYSGVRYNRGKGVHMAEVAPTLSQHQIFMKNNKKCNSHGTTFIQKTRATGRE